ncbi:hypothetical protein BC629DRAFT_1440676 [Irpex lacteus]|nr:hypothetical protein BC629DRAFT_1440676 [Irpex lacteus]
MEKAPLACGIDDELRIEIVKTPKARSILKSNFNQTTDYKTHGIWTCLLTKTFKGLSSLVPTESLEHASYDTSQRGVITLFLGKILELWAKQHGRKIVYHRVHWKATLAQQLRTEESAMNGLVLYLTCLNSNRPLLPTCSVGIRRLEYKGIRHRSLYVLERLLSLFTVIHDMDETHTLGRRLSGPGRASGQIQMAIRRHLVLKRPLPPTQSLTVETGLVPLRCGHSKKDDGTTFKNTGAVPRDEFRVASRRRFSYLGRFKRTIIITGSCQLGILVQLCLRNTKSMDTENDLTPSEPNRRHLGCGNLDSPLGRHGIQSLPIAPVSTTILNHVLRTNPLQLTNLGNLRWSPQRTVPFSAKSRYLARGEAISDAGVCVSGCKGVNNDYERDEQQTDKGPENLNFRKLRGVNGTS